MEISLRSKAQADKVFRVARALFNHSDIEELTSLSQNPCKTLQKKWHQLGPRQRIIKDSQLKKWYQAVLLLDNTHARDYLRITLFLGLRRNEAASLEWQYVDFDENTITIINTKNQRTHVAPMTRIVRQILLERREFLKATGEYGEYVFPGKSGHLKDPRKAICRVTKDCKIEFNSHDLRRTMATIADGLGIDYFTIGRMLNHKSAGGKAVTKDYIVSTAKALREPLERVNGYICEQIGIEKSA
jgi:integrase